MKYNTDFLKNEMKEIGFDPGDDQISQFITFYEYMTEKNKVMNLTGITEYEEVVTKHFIDSLSVNRVIDMNKIHSVMDVGTGAGFPGIPLKIMFPGIKFTLLDSLNKRVNFLKECFTLLHLDNIEAIHGRAEEYARRKEYREKYDLCLSRAVANLSTLSEYCLPYVKKDGYFISYKSGNMEEELKAGQKAISILGGKLERVEYFNLPDTDIQRSMVIIKKIKNTPARYPRKAGTPAKEPIA